MSLQARSSKPTTQLEGDPLVATSEVRRITNCAREPHRKKARRSGASQRSDGSMMRTCRLNSEPSIRGTTTKEGLRHWRQATDKTPSREVGFVLEKERCKRL
jgi:hypothetical protein